MIKYKLECNDCNIAFDSWFASSKEFEKLKKKNLLVCHICNSSKVDKTLMAPGLINNKKNLSTNLEANKYENVKRWFDDLENDKRFSNEIKIDGPLILFKQILKIKNKMMGKYLTDLVKF